MDYSKLSTEDLMALKVGDYSKVSTEGLMALKGQTPQQPANTSPFGADKGKLTIAQQRVQGPINPLKEMGKFSAEMQNTGTEMAEKIGEKAAGTPLQGMAPYLGAAVGTTVAMAPDIIGSMPMAPGAAVVGPKVAKRAWQAGKGGVNKLRSMAEVLTGPGKDEAALAGRHAIEGLEGRLLAQQEAASTLGTRTARRGADLALEKKELGKAINKAEELGGFPMKSSPDEFIETIKDPEAMKAFSNTMRKIAETPIDELVKGGDVTALQEVRKFGQTFRELGPKLNKEITKEITANVKMGAGKATEALSKIDETFGEVINAWSKADAKIKRLAPGQKAQKAAIAQSMRQTKHAIKKTKEAMRQAVAAGAKRERVRTLVASAFGVTGLAGLFGLMK